MKRLILLMMVAFMVIAISIAGIKKGDINTDTTMLTNVRLPDFIIVNNINREIITGSGSIIEWVGRTVDINRVFLRTDINVSDEGDVVVQSFQDVYREDVVITDHFIAFDPVDFGGDGGGGDGGGGGGGGDPLVFDLDGNNVPDVSQGINTLKKTFDRSRAKLFDLNADQIKDFVEWIGPNDGLIMFFENNKFKEDVNGFNLMSNAFGYKNGFEKLAENFDFDKDGKISGSELDNLYVWQDKNQDAKVQRNELLTFDKLGITELGTVYGEKMMEGYAKTKDGKIIKVWQWWPSVEWGISKK